MPEPRTRTHERTTRGSISAPHERTSSLGVMRLLVPAYGAARSRPEQGRGRCKRTAGRMSNPSDGGNRMSQRRGRSSGIRRVTRSKAKTLANARDAGTAQTHPQAHHAWQHVRAPQTNIVARRHAFACSGLLAARSRPEQGRGRCKRTAGRMSNPSDGGNRMSQRRGRSSGIRRVTRSKAKTLANARDAGTAHTHPRAHHA